MHRLLALLYSLIVLLTTGCSQNSHSVTQSVNLPQATHARTILGLAYLAQNEKEKALANLLIAYHYSPDDLEVNLALAHYYTTVSDNRQAQAHYQTMQQQYPDNPNLLNNYATFLCATDQGEEAKFLFDQALKVTPFNERVATYLNNGLCAQKNLEYQRAAENFSQVLLIDKANAIAYQGLIELAQHEQNGLKLYRLLQRYQHVAPESLPDIYRMRLNELKLRYN